MSCGVDEAIHPAAQSTLQTEVHPISKFTSSTNSSLRATIPVYLINLHTHEAQMANS